MRLPQVLLASFVLLALLAHPTPAPAQSASDPASLEEAAEERARQAEEIDARIEALRMEEQALRSRTILLARQAQDREMELARIEETLETLEEERSSRRQALSDDRERLIETLSALQRISLLPPEALAGAGEDPLNIVRSAMLLQVAVPRIEARGRSLRAELDDLEQLSTEIAERRGEIEAESEALMSERREIDALGQRAAGLRAELSEEAEALRAQAEELAQEAQSLRELMEALEREARRRAAEQAAAAEARRLALEAEAREIEEARRAAEERRRAEAAQREAEGLTRRQPDGSARSAQRGETDAPETSTPQRQQQAALPPAATARPDDIRAFPSERAGEFVSPVRGEIRRRYGESGDFGGETASRGVVIDTRDDAQVVAPFDGQVVYAGEFRSYGQILILEHRDGYHTLLAGLGRIDAVVGQWVLAGEPVARMSRPTAEAPGLYMELRREGRPINPLPWLATTGNKVQG